MKEQRVFKDVTGQPTVNLRQCRRSNFFLKLRLLLQSFEMIQLSMQSVHRINAIPLL